MRGCRQTMGMGKFARQIGRRSAPGRRCVPNGLWGLQERQRRLASAAAAASASSQQQLLLVGCYTEGHEPLAYYTNHAKEGAYTVGLDTADGSLSIVAGPVAAGTNPTYAAFDASTSTAYFTNENLDDGCVKAFRLCPEQGTLTALNEQPVDGCHPCYLSVTAGKVLCANYVSGDLTTFPIGADGSLDEGKTTPLPPTPGGFKVGPVEIRQDAPHAHCYEPLGDSFGLCCDLGSDLLLSIKVDGPPSKGLGQVFGKCELRRGSGPRHVAVSADGSMIYVSHELGNLISAVQAYPASGSLEPAAAAVASILPEDYDGPETTASHIELSPCGGYAYVANRVGVPLDGACVEAAEGAISVIALNPTATGNGEQLQLIDFMPIGGKVPRGFTVVPAAAGAVVAGQEVRGWLVVGAQESGFLKCYGIKCSDGLLIEVAHGPLDIPSPGVVVAI